MDLGSRFVPWFVNASSHAVGKKWSDAGFYRYTSGAPVAFAAKAVCALSDNGTIFGVAGGTPPDPGQPADSLNPYFWTVAAGTQTSVTTLLPLEFRKQISFTESTGAQMNSTGDLLFTTPTLEGPEDAPVWNSQKILWMRQASTANPNGTLAIVTNPGIGLNEDRLMVDIRPVQPPAVEGQPPAPAYQAAKLLLPVEVRAFQYVNGPHGSPPMYSPPRPDNGNASGELFSLWPNEKTTFRIGEPIAGMLQRNELPAGTVRWTADEVTGQNDTAAFEVQWATPGARLVTLNIGSSTYSMLVNVPNTGSYDLNSPALIARVGPGAYIQMGEYGVEARDLIIARYGEDPGTGGTRQDAIRHSTWNAMCAQDWGAASTLLVTTANEYRGRYSNAGLASNSTMDLHNNGHGAAVGNAYFPGMSTRKLPSELATELETKFANGELAAWTPTLASVSTHSSIIRKSNQRKFATP